MVKKVRLKRNDDVIVIAGNDRGKQGKILSVDAKRGLAFVQGVRLVKRHKKADQNTREGGIITSEAGINISNLAYLVKPATKTKPASYSKLGLVRRKEKVLVRLIKRTATEI